MITTISERQEDLLSFIEQFTGRNGYPPTHEEIRTALNFSSKSLVNYHLEALENANLLSRVPNKSRGIRLKTDSNGASSASVEPSTELSPLDFEDVLELTYDCVTNENHLFALKVADEILADEFVNQGDIVILQEQPDAQNGELVAVRLPHLPQTTLKRYFRENGHVRLQSVEPATVTTLVDPATVEVRGKVVAVIRNVT